MTFYAELAGTVNELLSEFGQPVVITKFAIGHTNPATGLTTQESSVTNGSGVLLDFEYRSFGENIAYNAATLGADKRLLCSASVVINPGDNIEVDKNVYKVLVAKLINPAGTRVLYDLWIKL